MKAVMMSIQPKWCELIASGKKTIEVRKTRPKLETPFKCYIYETKAKYHYAVFHENTIGKVIGEFVCDTYIVDKTFGYDPLMYAAACMSESDIAWYCTNKEMYGWHISDLVIYDEPKEFYNFCRPCDKNCDKCNYLEVQEIGNFEHTKVFKTCLNRITRPPQSWCYVEELV